MKRDSTKRRFAMSSGPQSLVPRGRSTIGTPGVGGGSPLTFLRKALDEIRKGLARDPPDSISEDPETSAAALLRPVPCPPTYRFRCTKLSQYCVNINGGRGRLGPP